MHYSVCILKVSIYNCRHWFSSYSPWETWPSFRPHHCPSGWPSWPCQEGWRRADRGHWVASLLLSSITIHSIVLKEKLCWCLWGRCLQICILRTPFPGMPVLDHFRSFFWVKISLGFKKWFKLATLSLYREESRNAPLGTIVFFFTFLEMAEKKCQLFLFLTGL